MRRLFKGLALLASTAVVLPYTVAILCNILYGWPLSKDRVKKSLMPLRVIALNKVILQKLMLIKYASLYVRWNYFYKHSQPAHVVKDICFGRNDRMLDLYHPEGIKDPSPVKPVAIFVYGGAWGTGDKSMYGLLCTQLANKLNAIVCCINYSLFPQGFVDDMIQDVVDCLTWVHENCHKYGGNKENIMLVGHSAGAHLCAMAILELHHEEVARTGRGGSVTQLTDSIQFEEGYFKINHPVNLDERERSETLGESSGSSGSYCVVNENNEQSANNFEVVNGSKSGEQFDATTIKIDPFKDKNLQESVDALDSEDIEEQSENDSIITVKNSEIEGQSSLSSLRKSIKAFIGLAGVYDINDHYRHEAKRGIEDLSYMAKAMYGEEHFDRFSPCCLIKNLQQSISLPKIVLLHGTEDFIVPLTSTTKFGEILMDINSDVTVRVIPSCDHVEICLDLMAEDRKFYNSLMSMLIETGKKVF